jgi:hypothetical protein
MLSEIVLVTASGFSGKGLEKLKRGWFWKIRPKGSYFEAKVITRNNWPGQNSAGEI